MATLMAKLKAVPGNLMLHGSAQRGFKGTLIDKGERYGAALAYGYGKGFYHEKFMWKGHGLDAWTGAGLLVLSAMGNAGLGGRAGHALAPHLERVGDAGVMSALGSLGASWGAEKAGRTVAVITPGKNARPLTAMHGHVLGAIPPAKAGPFLTADQIANFAQRR